MSQTLCDLLNKYKSDKGDKYKCAHNYVDMYETCFNKLKNKNKCIDFLEIGLNRDDCNSMPSLTAFKEYFSGENVSFYGFDIQVPFIRFHDPNNKINIIIGDQSNKQHLTQLTNFKYDVIIDDGYHASKHQQISFVNLWDSIKEGGYYFIEDLHFQPHRETCTLTKKMFEEWKNGNFIETEFVDKNFIEKFKNTVGEISFCDSKSLLWNRNLLKNALVCIRKKEKKEVNSFDVFDTLIARRCTLPTDIFEIIEKTYFPNFKSLRIQAEINTLTFDDIYLNFQKLTSISDEGIKRLKDFEIETEINNSYLIKSNCNLVKDGDILISDMYLSSQQIMKILNALGFDKNVTIFSSSCGKAKYNGSMYEYLKPIYDINLHIGDNQHSDILMAERNNINSKLTSTHKINKTEQFFIDTGYSDFAFMLREFRHTNPYPENSKDFLLFDDQISVNIPILIYISQKLNQFMVKNNKDTALLTARDCSFLEHIFPTLYPELKYKRYESSRRININYNEEYKTYVKNTYNDSCVIVDLNGSFQTGRKLYLEVFNKLPDVLLFCYNKCDAPFDSLNHIITVDQLKNDTSFFIEHYNTDIVGTILGLKDGDFIRRGLEYELDDVLVYKNTIVGFCKFIEKKKIPDLLDINIVNLYETIIREHTIKNIMPDNYVNDVYEIFHLK